MEVSSEAAAKRRTAEATDRAASITVILDVVGRRFASNPLVSHIVATEGALSPELESVQAIFAPKSTGTIQKRAVYIRIFDIWFARAGLPNEKFIDEPTLFNYVAELRRQGSSSSRGASVRSALFFLGGLFGICTKVIQKSARVYGMCSSLLREGLVHRQRDPLRVSMVRAFEEVLVDDAGRGGEDAIIAGTALFCIFGRLRVGDLRRCKNEPIIDDAGGDAYLETHFVDHKTARPGTRRALPVVAPAAGLISDWAKLWLLARKSAKLDANLTGTLVPAMAGDGGWHQVPYTTTEFGRAFLDILTRKGFGADALDNVGSHSLKTTCLSWLAKFGVNQDHRRHLGYHVRPGERTVELYARDVLASPLRSLLDVLHAVRDGRFDPDSTRSGAFVSAASAAPPAAVDACSVADEIDQRAVEVPVPSSTSSSSSTADEDDQAPKVIRNNATGVYHMSGTEVEKMACGKSYPKEFSTFTELPGDGRRCPWCFGSLR